MWASTHVLTVRLKSVFGRIRNDFNLPHADFQDCNRFGDVLYILAEVFALVFS